MQVCEGFCLAKDITKVTFQSDDKVDVLQLHTVDELLPTRQEDSGSLSYREETFTKLVFYESHLFLFLVALTQLNLKFTHKFI